MSKLNGFLFPQSATGRSSVLPAPPWHYVGDLLTITFQTDPEAVKSFLPDEIDLVPEEPGVISAVFADWQSCSDERNELIDPVLSQYREFYIDVPVVYRGSRYGRVILIWVDKDFAMVRGHHQGYPKRLGSVAMTRPTLFGRAGPKLAVGEVFGATLAANDRRLVDAVFTISEKADNGATTSTALPRLHSRRVPAIEVGGPDRLNEYITFEREGFERGPLYRGTAELGFLESPYEELALLRPDEVLGATYTTVASTWNGGTTLE